MNLSCVIPLYLKFGLRLRIKTFGLLLPTSQERRTMIQMQNHAKNEVNWNGCFTDLFASRLNGKPPVFVSYHPDPVAMNMNAFSISWWDRPFYAFPPFAVIGQHMV